MRAILMMAAFAPNTVSASPTAAERAIRRLPTSCRGIGNPRAPHVAPAGG